MAEAVAALRAAVTPDIPPATLKGGKATASINMPTQFVRVRAGLSPKASFFLGVGAFLIPLLVWSAISYFPFLWHPKVLIEDSGEVGYFMPGMLVDRPIFDEENDKLRASGGMLARGTRENPVYLPAPHLVAKAFVTAFLTPPQLAGDPWLHESLGHSVRVIFLGFGLSALLGLPLGILAGSFASFSRLTEPFVDFIRYMPAPAFGACLRFRHLWALMTAFSTQPASPV